MIKNAFLTQKKGSIELSLNETGLAFSDIVEMTTYHVGLKEHLEDFKRIKDGGQGKREQRRDKNNNHIAKGSFTLRLESY